jgi:hypothetical protein
MNALVGLLGVLAGAGIASAFGFWSTRRKELAAAVVAAAIVVDELIAVRDALEEDAFSPVTLARVSSLTAFWTEKRRSLVLYVHPQQFVALNGIVRLATEFASSATDVPQGRAGTVSETVNAVLGWLVPRSEELREAHQAFILTPLFKYLATSPWRRKRGHGQRRG